MQALPCKAISEAFAWSIMELSCKRCLFQAIFAGSCVALSCKGCRLKLLLKFFVWSCHGMTCKSCLAKLLLKLWHGQVVQRLRCKAMSQSFAWNSRAEAALRIDFVSSCIELSCKHALFPKLLHGSFVHKVALQTYFLSFCLELSCKSCPMNLFCSFCMELCKSFLPKLFLKFLRATVVQKLPFEAII